MTEIYPGFIVGGMDLCTEATDKYVIHCAKNPCHQKAVGYQSHLPKLHPEYLVALRGTHLYLNMIDPPVPLFSVELFTHALDFIDEMRPQGDVLIHCNQGKSRAPSLVAVYFAKRMKVIPGESWAEAKEALARLMPDFKPGAGIDTFLTEKWGDIK